MDDSLSTGCEACSLGEHSGSWQTGVRIVIVT